MLPQNFTSSKSCVFIAIFESLTIARLREEVYLEIKQKFEAEARPRGAAFLERLSHPFSIEDRVRFPVSFLEMERMTRVTTFINSEHNKHHDLNRRERKKTPHECICASTEKVNEGMQI